MNAITLFCFAMLTIGSAANTLFSIRLMQRIAVLEAKAANPTYVEPPRY